MSCGKLRQLTSIVVGVIMAIAGVVTWVVVSSTLEDQRITVSDDANCAAGDNVTARSPRSAKPTSSTTHPGDHRRKTYAELPQDDPNRAVAMDSAFLQASLFTSVVAFGVAGMAFVLGIVLTARSVWRCAHLPGQRPRSFNLAPGRGSRVVGGGWQYVVRPVGFFTSAA